jgi:serine/threonine-protein kinase
MRFGRYTLLSLVAKGGMGEVYLARMAGVEGFEKFVVIKKILPVLAQQQDFVERFVDEAKIVVKLQHGSIAQVLDMGVEDGEYYIAMEFVDGKDLRKVASRMRDQGAAMPVSLAIYLTVRVLDALAYAHRKKDSNEQELNLVHRDISPQNILVSYEGEVKVIDFGLAKSAASLGRTSPSVVLGKFFYMSPEQARHKAVDRRSDLYAAAICLWELLAGRNPFDGVPQFEIMRAVANPAIPSIKAVRPDLPDSLDQALMKGLAVEPDERYATAEEMRGRLTAVMLEIDPAAGPELLAAFMHEQFAREYESERKAIASLAKLCVEATSATEKPSAEVAKAQAAFKPTAATGAEATAAGASTKTPLVPRQPVAPRTVSRQEPAVSAPRRTRDQLDLRQPAPERHATPVERPSFEVDEPLEPPTPVGQQAFQHDDPPTPVAQAVSRARARTPRRVEAVAEASQTEEQQTDEPQTQEAQVVEERHGSSALLIGVGVACLLVALALGAVVFRPLSSSGTTSNRLLSGPQPATPVLPPEEVEEPARGLPMEPVARPDPAPTAVPELSGEPAPQLEPAAESALPASETLVLLRSGQKLSKRQLVTAFRELQLEIKALKSEHGCSALGAVCSLSEGMELQYRKLLPMPQKHEHLRTLLHQWAEALHQRRQLLAGSK